MSKQLITHSRMASFKSCRKRHHWEYELCIRRTTDAKALRMGGAYHAGLDALKAGDDIDTAALAARVYYDQFPLTETDDETRDRQLETETVVAMVSGYQWRWSESTLQVLASEQAFRLPLTNPDTGAASKLFDLAGKIDGIVKLEDGRLAVLEHKLQSDDIEPESDYWRRLQLDHQITLYVYAARQLGYDVATVLYDVARKPTIRPEKVSILDADGLKIVLDAAGNRVLTKQGKPRQTGSTEDGYVVQSRPMTCEEWVAKLLEDIGQRPTWYYARQEIPRLDQDIEEFMAECWDIQQVLRDAQLKQRWYRTVSHDSCTWCAYFGLCTSKFSAGANEIPEGFQFVENLHPELGESINATVTPS